MSNSTEYPARFREHRQQLQAFFRIEELSDDTQNALNIDPTVEWTKTHEQLVELFAIAVYDTNPFLSHGYTEIYHKYTTTVETGEIPDSLEDPALQEFATILLDNPELADDFLTRYDNTILIRD